MAEVDDTLLLDQKLEDRFFVALLEHEKLLPLVKDALLPEHFSSKVKASLFQSMVHLFEEYGQMMSDDMLLITVEHLFNEDVTSLVSRYLKKIGKLPVPEWEWVIKQVDLWIKKIRLHKSLFEAKAQLNEDNYEKARDIVIQTIQSAGIIYHDKINELKIDAEEMYDVVHEEDLLVTPTRIYALDEVIKGLYREELLLILSPLNVGKTWAALHLACAALLSGKHVLHLSLEMNRKRVMQRVYQMVSGMVYPLSETEKHREVPMWDEDFAGRPVQKVDSLMNIAKAKEFLDNLAAFGGVLSVADYPSGVCTLADIHKEIQYFDIQFGKLPDVVIIDGLMDLNLGGKGKESEKRYKLADTTRAIRRLGSEYYSSIVLTHQTNRDGLTADIVDASHTGENLAIVQIADSAISLNQTRKENRLGKIRIFLLRARNSKKWVMVEGYQNLDIGQFCQVSRIIPPEEYDMDSEEEEVNQRESKNRKKRRSNRKNEYQ